MYQAVMVNKHSHLETAKISSFPKLFGAVAGIFGGLILMLTGMILSIISYFSRMSFHGLEVIVIIAAFIFLAIGAHFLDLMDIEKKARRIENYQKHRLADQDRPTNTLTDKQLK